MADHLILGLGLGAGMLIALLRSLFYGYPQKRVLSQILSAKEQAIVTACAETMFPRHATLPLSGVEAEVVETFDKHLFMLPADKRFQIRLLLAFIEHSPFIFGRGFVRGRRRFSALSPESRHAFLLGLAQSRIYFCRICFLSLRTLLCMAYLEHPAIFCRIGCTPNLQPFDRQKEEGRA